MGALAAALISAASLGAQQPSGTPRRIGFTDAVNIALTQNASIRQAENATELAAATVKQQRMVFLPDLRLNTSGSNSLGRTFSQDEGGIVNQTTQSVNAGLSSSVTVFDGFRNQSALRGARLDERASTQDLARSKQTVVFTVATNFLALVSNEEQLRVQKENLVALEQQEAQIQQFVTAGARPISDLYQQQAAVANARAGVVETERALELAKVDLIQTLQLDPRGAYDFVPPAVDTSGATRRSYNLDSLMTRAFEQRTDLDAAQSRLEAAGQDVRAAEGGRLPTVSLSAGYNTSFNSASEGAFVDQFDNRRGGSLSVGVSLPIFDRGNTALNTQRARLQAENERIAFDNSRQEVAIQVRRAYLDHQAAQKRLEAAEAQHRAARQATEASEQRYRVGAATIVELTQSRAGLVQAASALVSARYNLVFSEALMSYYTGELDPGAVTLRS